MYLNIIYVFMHHCRFGIYTSIQSFWYMVYPDRTNRSGLNQLNISGLECVYLSGCSQFEQVGTGWNWFLAHVR